MFNRVVQSGKGFLGLACSLAVASTATAQLGTPFFDSMVGEPSGFDFCSTWSASSSNAVTGFDSGSAPLSAAWGIELASNQVLRTIRFRGQLFSSSDGPPVSAFLVEVRLPTGFPEGNFGVPGDLVIGRAVFVDTTSPTAGTPDPCGNVYRTYTVDLGQDVPLDAGVRYFVSTTAFRVGGSLWPSAERFHHTRGSETVTGGRFATVFQGYNAANNYSDVTPIETWVTNTVSGSAGFQFFSEAPAAPCNAADLDAPFGTLDFNDINAFVEIFLGGSPSADLNGDMALDFGDIEAFVEAFLGGCP